MKRKLLRIDREEDSRKGGIRRTVEERR